MLRDAVLHARSAKAFYLPVVTKIDFFGRGYEPFDESEFSRRRATVVRASGESLVVKSAEDTVLRKLLWFRDGGSVSEKQWRDVVSVLASARVLSMIPTWGPRLSNAIGDCSDEPLLAENAGPTSVNDAASPAA